MNLRLRTRIFIGSFLLILVTIGALGIPLLIVVRDHALDEVESSLMGDAFQTASLVVAVLESSDPAAIEGVAKGVSAQTGARVTVTDATGHLVFDSDTPGREVEDFTNRPEIQTALSGLTATEIRHSQTLNTDLLVVTVPVARAGKVVGVVRLSRDIAEVRADQLRASIGVGVLLALLAAAGAWVASIVSRGVTRPLIAIADTAEMIGRGELEARALEAGPPEIRSLARTLNDSARRVGSAIATERSFMGNAAHQLKTPLTALGIRLEAIGDSVDLNDSARRDLAAARSEVQALSRLIDQMLTLSRTSEPGAVLLEQPSDATPVLVSVAKMWREQLADLGIDLETEIEPDLPPIALPPELVAQASENLLDNIAKYCPDSDRASFRAGRAADESLEITVSDSGPGLDANSAERAFDRFVRGQTPASGSGLGLAVVRQVAEAAGGTVDLTTSADGTTVQMRIPGYG